jgi:hypothetical protein
LTLILLLTACESSDEYWLKNPEDYNAAIMYVDDAKSSDAPASIIALPKSIKDSCEKHLLTQAGATFYSRLNYTGGQILEYTNGHKEYYLHFSFSDPGAGIKKYTATVVLNGNGSLIEQIDLPEIAKQGSKSAILNIKDAYKIALSKTIDKGKLFNACISFDKNTRSIEWTFTLETAKGEKEGYKHISA